MKRFLRDWLGWALLVWLPTLFLDHVATNHSLMRSLWVSGVTALFTGLIMAMYSTRVEGSHS